MWFTSPGPNAGGLFTPPDRWVALLSKMGGWGGSFGCACSTRVNRKCFSGFAFLLLPHCGICMNEGKLKENDPPHTPHPPPQWDLKGRVAGLQGRRSPNGTSRWRVAQLHGRRSSTLHHRPSLGGGGGVGWWCLPPPPPVKACTTRSQRVSAALQQQPWPSLSRSLTLYS